LTAAAVPVTIVTMPRPAGKTMSELLREAIGNAESIRAVAKATGLNHASLVRFVNGERSLRLDMADKLAMYFGFVLTKKTRKAASR
jgi:plasmid maintenance system antidote protein VapI